MSNGPGPNVPSGKLSPYSILHKQALASGWRVFNTPAGSFYSNPRTGATRSSPPLPSGWTTVNTMAGTRYVGAGGQTSVEMPTTPSVATSAAGAGSDADKATGNVKPKPVVSAKGLMSDDAGKPRMSGGQKMLTTPFGVLGGAPVKKKKLLGG